MLWSGMFNKRWEFKNGNVYRAWFKSVSKWVNSLWKSLKTMPWKCIYLNCDYCFFCPWEHKFVMTDCPVSSQINLLKL